MKKQNIVECEVCGKKFDNYYKRGRFVEKACSRSCVRKLRLKEYIKINREKRHKLRAEHKCIICAKEIKPIIVYHQFCPKHKPKK